MQSTPRPLPGAPPTHLTSGQSPEIRSYRPLPTPPVQAAGTHHSFENIYLRTHPALAASSAGPSNLLSRPRPKLHISVKSPIPKRKNSLDSLTVRTPAFRDPGQALVPAVDRWRNPVNVDRSRSRHTPHNSVLSRVSSAKSFGSRPVVKGRASTVGPYVRESEEDGRPVLASRIPRPENGIFGRIVTLQPPRLQPIPIKGPAGINCSTTAARVVTYVDEDSDDETIGLKPYSVSSIDLTNGREFYVSGRRRWRSLLNTAKVAMKSCLSRSPKPQCTKSGHTTAVEAKRVSQLATPLHRAWYKERGGWRWVERDVGEVLSELRKLQ